MRHKPQSLFTPPSPGKVLRRYIVEGEGVTQDDLAVAMKVSRLTVNRIINDKRTVTAEMALRLARVLHTTPEFWLDLQRGTDLYKARRALAAKLDKMPVLRRPAA